MLGRTAAVLFAVATAAVGVVTHVRRAPVRWSAPSGEVRDRGLSVRVAGQGPPHWVLLHGMFRSGRYWSSEFDRLGGTVVAPDLLGFGRSRGAAPPAAQQVTAALHVDAIAQCLDDLGVTDPVVLVAHSVGAVVAAHFAHRHPHRVRGLVGINPALYPNAEEARSRLANAGPYIRLFLRNRRFSETACESMCRHRSIARAVTRVANPHMPDPVNADAVEHTWPSFHGLLDNVLLTDDHPRLISQLSCPVHLIVGADDELMDLDFIEHLSAMSHVTCAVVPEARHDFPISDPGRCAALVRSAPPLG